MEQNTFAVIKTGGKQYHVFSNDLIVIEKVFGNIGDKIEFNNVLAVSNSSEIIFGKPILNNVVVKGEIVEQIRFRKVISFKKRRRKNSKRKIGHRQQGTKLRILEIINSNFEK